MSRRQSLTAAHLHTAELYDPDENTLSAQVTSGPAGTIGRGLSLQLTDEEVRALLVRLAVLPRWAPAIMAAARDETVRKAAAGTYLMNSGSARKGLAGAMREAMAAVADEVAADNVS